MPRLGRTGVRLGEPGCAGVLIGGKREGKGGRKKEDKRDGREGKRGPGERREREEKENPECARVFRKSKPDYIAFGFFEKTREITDLPFFILKKTVITHQFSFWIVYNKPIS